MANDVTLAHQSYVSDPSGANLNALLGSIRACALRRARRCTGLDAEDIAQQAMIAAWQGLPGYTGGSNITTWVTAITDNKVKTALKQKYSEPKLEPMQAWEVDLHPHSDARPQPMLMVDIFEHLPGCLNEADKDLLLRLQRGESQINIAAALGITPSAFRNRLSRLKQKIIRNSDTFPR
jgi:RNA polymerase sigma factor (sigma-70 family)